MWMLSKSLWSLLIYFKKSISEEGRETIKKRQHKAHRVRLEREQWVIRWFLLNRERERREKKKTKESPFCCSLSEKEGDFDSSPSSPPFSLPLLIPTPVASADSPSPFSFSRRFSSQVCVYSKHRAFLSSLQILYVNFIW